MPWTSAALLSHSSNPDPLQRSTLELKPVTPTAKAPAQAFTGDGYVTSIYREKTVRLIVRSTDPDGW